MPSAFSLVISCSRQTTIGFSQPLKTKRDFAKVPAPKAVPRKDPVKRGSWLPASPAAPRVTFSVFHSEECDHLFLSLYTQAQTQANSFPWCLFLWFPVALLRLPSARVLQRNGQTGRLLRIKMLCPPRDAQQFRLQSPGVLSSPCGSVWGSAFLVLSLLPSSLTQQVEGKCWVLAPRPREKESVPLLSSFGPSWDPTSCLWRAPCMLQGVDSETQPHFSGKIWFLSPPILPGFPKTCARACVGSIVSVSVTPWAVAHQAPLSMGFSRQVYRSGLPFPSPGDLPGTGIEPVSPVLAGGFFTTSASWKAPDVSVPEHEREQQCWFKRDVHIWWERCFIPSFTFSTP